MTACLPARVASGIYGATLTAPGRNEGRELVPTMVRGKGVFFDEQIDLTDPEGEAFTRYVLEILAAIPRLRRLKAADLANRQIRVRKVLANAMRGHWFRDPHAVLYFRKVDTVHYEDKPSWMRHGALGIAIQQLADQGLLLKIKGRRMPAGSAKQSSASSYMASMELLDIASQCGVSDASIIHRVPRERLVQLYGPKRQTASDWDRAGQRIRKGKAIIFKPTAETAAWANALEFINDHYRQQVIVIGRTPVGSACWREQHNATAEDETAPVRRLETFKTDLYRVFNNGEAAAPVFEQGGRLYGGWWMSIPQGLRAAITINGLPTIEIDYASCHPRMLYHQQDMDADGDLYTLPEISDLEIKAGLKPGTYRPWVKWMMQVLLNGKGRPDKATREEHIITPANCSVNDLVGFIQNRHQPIGGYFKTGIGLRLMRIEGDIGMEIVSTAAAEGWTALPIHDSFIAATDKRDRLEELMVASYFRRLGRQPLLKS